MHEIFKRLFSPMKMAGQTIPYRIPMAPLTRQMAEADDTPTDEMTANSARHARDGFGLNIPVITNGCIADSAKAETCLKEAGGDRVAIGRQSFTHPDWPYIVRSGQTYNCLPFDRKCVIRLALDYGIAYPTSLQDPKWSPKFK